MEFPVRQASFRSRFRLETDRESVSESGECDKRPLRRPVELYDGRVSAPLSSALEEYWAKIYVLRKRNRMGAAGRGAGPGWPRIRRARRTEEQYAPLPFCYRGIPRGRRACFGFTFRRPVYWETRKEGVTVSPRTVPECGQMIHPKAGLPLLLSVSGARVRAFSCVAEAVFFFVNRNSTGIQ